MKTLSTNPDAVRTCRSIPADGNCGRDRARTVWGCAPPLLPPEMEAREADGGRRSEGSGLRPLPSSSTAGPRAQMSPARTVVRLVISLVVVVGEWKRARRNRSCFVPR
ncbi:unnamed protein product [Cuscuta epithymum]|uniref:Uncharacterized protein n=1 Tax=Cuscuta epithymum TaxID=186058 RepID=A0AAV0GHK2_9ASTE|nr:unnamed protein product [Cuscuta epithymum]